MVDGLRRRFTSDSTAPRRSHAPQFGRLGERAGVMLRHHLGQSRLRFALRAVRTLRLSTAPMMFHEMWTTHATRPAASFACRLCPFGAAMRVVVAAFATTRAEI